MPPKKRDTKTQQKEELKLSPLTKENLKKATELKVKPEGIDWPDIVEEVRQNLPPNTNL